MNTATSGAHSKVTGRLTENDGRGDRARSEQRRRRGPGSRRSGQVVYGDKNVATEIVGTTLPYFPIRRWEIAKGEFWTEQDESVKTKVCLIGSTVRDKLFGDGADPVGQTVRIAALPVQGHRRARVARQPRRSATTRTIAS